MIHELVGSEEVTGSINDGTVSNMSDREAVGQTSGSLAAKYSRINSGGTEITTTTVSHSFL